MKNLTRSLALFLALQPTLALAQSAPANLGYHTVYGRLGAVPGDTGPGQAIPFSTLTQQLLAGQVSNTFVNVATAAATIINANVNAIYTLGRNTAGDNGGASYIRVGSTTAAAWRFQSADGQWWALNNRTVTPEMFGAVGDGATDNTAVLQSVSTWLNTFTGTGSDRGGIIVNLFPRASYKIWPAGTTPSTIFNLTSVGGVTFNFNGARIFTDNLFAPQGSPTVFAIAASNQLTFNNPFFQQTAYTTLSPSQGANFFYFSSSGGTGSSDILLTNFKQIGGVIGLAFATANYTATSSHGITLLNASYDSVYYPMSFQFAGDNFFARGVNAINCGRVYFPYGVANHDVEIFSSGSQSAHDDLLIKQYFQPTASVERNTLSNIRVRYRNTGQPSASGAPTLVALELQQIVAPMNVSGAANNGSGKVRLAVDSTANAATGQTWNFAAVGGTVEANGTNVITVVDATHIDLLTVNWLGNAYTSGGYGRVPGGMKNIDIGLDVSDITGNGQPPAVITRKYNYDGTTDTSVDGYVLDNIGITGTLKNYNTGVDVFNMFTNTGLPGPIGTWTGETLRNIRLHDLVVTGTSAPAVIDATNITSLQLENIWSTPTSVSWTITDPNNVRRPTNVSATGITDRQAVTPSTAATNQFFNSLNSQGVLGSAQPAIGGVSGLGTGVATFLGTPTSANLRGALTDETGTGAAVFAGGNIGAATATSLNGLGITTTTGTLTIPNGVTLTGPAASGTAMTLGNTETVTGTKTFNAAQFANNSFLALLDSGGSAGSGLINTSTNVVEVINANNNELRFGTGFSSSAANIISFYTGLTEKARFSNSGGLSLGSTVDPGAGVLRLKPQTFASLTACSSTIEGAQASVTDSSTAVWGATVTGSSTNHVLAYCDGTQWTVAGK